MNYLLLLATVPFIVLSIILYRGYKNWKKSYNNLSSKYKDLQNSVNDMNKTLRKGYYSDTVKFSEEKGSKTTDDYNCMVYVDELDRYTNGDSKIKLTSVEVVSGYHRNLYPEAKSTIKKKFCSIKQTKDIEWLESEEHIKEQRRKKLETILEKIDTPEKTI